jgi:hypothetical protein
MTHDEKLATIRAMKSLGGGFVSALAEAWLRADEDNSKRIQDAFPDYVAKYRALSLKYAVAP